MLSIGAIIWISVRPLIRLVLCVGFGFAVTKADIFPVIASRGAGQIILNITLPCLMFSQIVPAFSTSNIGALGPLFLVACLYEALGMLIAWTVKQFFWVPHRFRYGILFAGGWSNYADLPTAVVMSIMSEPPFNTATDQNIAIAYVSAFIFIFFLTLFPLGGNRMIAWDFVGPKVEDEERREMVRLKRQAIFRSWRTIASTFSSFVKRYRRNGESTVKEHSSGEDLSVEHEKSFQAKYDRESIPPEAPSCLSSRTLNMILNASLADVATILPREPEGVRSAEDLITVSTRVISPAPSLTQAETVTQVEQRGGIAKEVRFDELNPPPCRTMTRRLLLNFRTFALGLLSPASLSVILAFPIALITPLKGLLVSLPNSPIPNAPDGQPPLAFIMDTATFVGAASVPLGLICLGSALARLKVPMNAWNTMPLGSILSLAVGKIVLMPVLGVLICQGLTNVGVIDKDDKVLRFVCIFFSCLPTATSQVYLTQVYSGTGTAEHISAFLIPQYILMIFSMTILTAYSIHILF